MTEEDKTISCSYDTLCAIVKWSGMVQKENLIRHFSILRNIEARLNSPYHFGYMEIFSQGFQFTETSCWRRWTFQIAPRPRDPRMLDSTRLDLLAQEAYFDRPHTYEVVFETEGRKSTYPITTPVNEALTKLVQEYLRPKSQIDTLKINLEQHDSLTPEGVETENWKLKVKNLNFPFLTKKVFDTWIAAIDLDNGRRLDSIEFPVTNETMFMFKEPVVQTTKKLVLKKKKMIGMMGESWVFNLPNKHIEICHNIYTFETLALIPKVWAENRRQLGATFTQLLIFPASFVNFSDYLQKTIKVIPSKFADVKGNEHQCFTFPIDEHLELVIYEDRIPKGTYSEHYARFEMMRKGTTIPRDEKDGEEGLAINCTCTLII